MDNNWVVDNLERALSTWNNRFSEIWQAVSSSPEEFRGGEIWGTITSIYGALQAVGLALLVLFFVIGVAKTCTSFEDVKRPEQGLKLFIRFAIAKGVITYGKDLMMSIFKIVQGIISKIFVASEINTINGMHVPNAIIDTIKECGFFESIPLWAVTLIGSLFITILSFVMILTIYGRFFKLYMYTAIAPIPLSTLAGEPTQNVAKSFIKSYTAVCLEGVIILIACIIFSKYVSVFPNTHGGDTCVAIVWSYIADIVFNMLVLVGTVKMSDRIVREMMGL